ncbi:MAG: TonB-dependent receptor [Bacteroidota bacterium]
MINLNNTNFSTHMIWIFFTILSFFFIATGLNAQNNAIQGTVKDVDGNPILGANVILLESSKGVSSNLEGEFIIQGLNKGSYFIQVRYLGYRPITRRINIPDDAIINFTLSEVFDQLDEVVVTANRRLQDIQKTAASVSAIGFKQVEQLQIKQFSELNSIAPNFRTYDDGGIGAFTLVASRGISTVDTNPAIGLYIDGIPYFSTLNFPLTLNDVNQIEVLRGPQGTLYGRNALAGVVKITTKSPSNQVTGYGNVGFGNLNSKEFGFGLSLPVVKNKLFFRTNANIQDRDGFVTNDFNDEELQNREAIDANFRMKYFASEKLDFSLLYSLQHREAKSSAFVLASEQNPLTSILENSPFEVNFNEAVFRDAFTQNMALNLNYRFGSFSLNSTTSYQVTDSERFDEFDYMPLDLQAGGGELTFQTVGQEFRLQSTAERSLNWTSGVFLYLNRDKRFEIFENGADGGIANPDIATIVPFNRFDDTVIEQKGVAVYGQASYALSDKFTVTGGLRFDYEENNSCVDRSFSTPALPEATFSQNAEFDALSPKISLSYQANDKVFLFVNVARGFRPGGVNTLVSDPADAPYDPENTLNYELGIKTTLLENRLKLNFTGFLVDYTDQQVFTLINLEDFVVGTENIGKSRNFGVEFESQWSVRRGLGINLNLGYLNTDIREYNPIDFFTGQELDFSGRELPYSPEFNGNLNVNYILPLSKKINLESNFDYNYQTDIFFDFANTDAVNQEAYGLLNGRLGVTSKNLDVFIWGKNLTDETYFSYGFGSGGLATAAFGLSRTYGAAVTAKF